ncbi:MAG: hypothetical protein ACKV2T_31420 [Kofleriaceae bacterium]
MFASSAHGARPLGKLLEAPVTPRFLDWGRDVTEAGHGRVIGTTATRVTSAHVGASGCIALVRVRQLDVVAL